MKKIHVAILGLLLTFLNVNVCSAAFRYWVGAPGGIFSNPANWNTLSDGSGISGIPQTGDDIVIDRNASLIIDGTYNPASVWIINNATVVFSASSTKTLTIGAGSVSPAFKIESGASLSVTGNSALTITLQPSSAFHLLGTLDFSANNSRLDNSNASGGITYVKNGGKLRYGGGSSNGLGTFTTLIMEAGSTYEIYRNGGEFPIGTYDPASLILNTGSTNTAATFAMASSFGSYGNYEFNSSSYTNTNAGFNRSITVNDFTLTNTGTGKWVFSTSNSAAFKLSINGNCNLATGTVLDINRAPNGTQATTISIGGDMDNNGTITESNGNRGCIIEFTGNQLATIECVQSGITNDVSVKLNKPTAILRALSDIYLPNSSFAQLIFAAGNLDVKTNGKFLFMQNPASAALVGGSLGSHVIGRFLRNTNQATGYDFPVSDNEFQWAKAAITPASATLTQWSIEYLPSNPYAAIGLIPGVIDEVSDYYWNVEPSGAASPTLTSVRLFYEGLLNPTILLPQQVNVVRWNGASWQTHGGLNTGGAVSNTLGTSGGSSPADLITGFGPFALGGVLNTLPVTLEYFNGARLMNANELTWKISCSGTPGIQMELVRSADGRNMAPIHTEYAEADRCRDRFHFIDDNPLPGLNYYRLLLKDIDGRVTFSRFVLINNNTNYSGGIRMFPNPSPHGMLTLQMESLVSAPSGIIITDVKGRIMKRIPVMVRPGLNQFPLLLTSLAPGTYLVRIEGMTEAGKVIIP